MFPFQIVGCEEERRLSVSRIILIGERKQLGRSGEDI